MPFPLKKSTPATARIRRHLQLAVSSIVLNYVFFFLFGGSVLAHWSKATAYTGLFFLALSLAIGPWNILHNKRNPVSSYLRRDIGIWAGIMGLIHTVIGLQVHMSGKFWLYFIYPPNQPHFIPIRYDPFGLANFSGLGAAIILLVLLCISNNASLRALGVARWKTIQRWNYVGAALVCLHGVLYQFIEKRTLPFILLFGVTIVMVIVIQLAGFKHRCN